MAATRQFFVSIIDFLLDQIERLFSGLQKFIGIRGMAYAFVLPNLLIFGVFILLPMIINFAYAFTGSDELFLENRPYVGTENFERLFTCEDYWDPNSCTEDLFIRAVQNTAIFVVTQVFFMIVISLITALVLNRNIAGRGFFRSVFFYPVLLSPIVVGLMWRWILQENGILNAMLDTAGQDTILFLSNASWTRFWVVVISIWSLMGFYTLILLAGLQAIPAQLYEASSIDGASEWRKFWSITLPLLRPTLLVVVVLSMIRAVQVFDVVFAFSGGGPGTATLYIVQYIYRNGFTGSEQQGLAAAASLSMATVLVVFTVLQLRVRGTSGAS